MNAKTKGDQAKNLKESPAFIYAMQALEKQLTESWRASKPKESELRERIYIMQTLMDDLNELLTRQVAEGVQASRELLKRLR